MRWDIFCRVIDNHGDLGVCWRLSVDLAQRGYAVRLWVDEAGALAWMAPRGHPRVEVLPWPQTSTTAVRSAGAQAVFEPGDVVIEAFGCELPSAFAAAMQARMPVWINLEYLSAEDYVQRSHGLPSPVSHGPAAGLNKWFFYPGFTQRTGGLIREPGLLEARAQFERDAWLTLQGVPRAPAETVISLFCYENPRLPQLLNALQDSPPRLLLVTQGWALDQVAAHLGKAFRAGQTLERGGLRLHALPALSQSDFDRLLWASDLNFVRGEDSFVRAQWAGSPMVWQIYPQTDLVHQKKLDAFLQCYTDSWPEQQAHDLRLAWHWWNGLSGPPDGAAALLLKTAAASSTLARSWCDKLLEQTDLTTQLIAFAQSKRAVTHGS